MKKSRLLGVLLSAVMLASCSGNAAEQEILDTASESSATTSEAAAAASETTAETTAKKVTETTAKTKTEEASKAAEKEYVKVSYGNRFIDYEFIEDYQGTTDIGDLADKAVEFLKESEYYAESMENIAEFTDGKFSEYIKDGAIVPKFNIAYPNDYNGDGSNETFIIVDMPYRMGTVNDIRNFVMFSAGYGHMEIINNHSGFESASLLNYGRFKHIIIGGNGIAGADEDYPLYGVISNRAEQLYHGRVAYYKEDCFLSTHGWMSSGEFMYYDTVEYEYRSIIGVQMTVDEIKEMDRDGVLAEFYENDEYGERIYGLVGGKYYCVNLGEYETEAVYTYDGKFEKVENSKVRYKLENSSTEKAVVDIDIKQALKNMKPPTERYVMASSDNRFIDYNFIANYPGTKDIGDLADKAVEFLKTTKKYSDAMKSVVEFTEKGIRRRYAGYDSYDDEESRERDIKEDIEFYSKYLDENGNILPRFKIAYPNDYDCDGSEEVFIVVDMPVDEGSSREIKSFLIFSGSDGKMQLIDSFSNAYPTVLLDYGICRHIAIGGSGIVGAADHTRLYGVRNDKAEVLYRGRCNFYKEDCFLAIYGWQGTGGYMYYDTSLQEYLAVGSVSLSMKDVKEMDKNNDLADYWFEDGEVVYFDLIGGKYYCASLGPMDTGRIYTYENGRFVLRDDVYARCTDDYEYSTAVDIDIDKAVSKMKPVAEPFSPITKGSTPIDFKYIENYQSESDLDQYKELIGEFVNKAYFYENAKYHTEELTDEKFAGFTDSDGNLIPKILAAYTNDYDGNGREETFVVFKIPYIGYYNDYDQLELKSFAVLTDRNGKINRRDYYYGCPANTDGKAVILDYGDKKHILFADSKENTVYLYGVSGSRTEEYFSGKNCTFKKNGCTIDVSYVGDGGCVLYYDNLADDYLTLSGRNFSSGSNMPNPIKVPNG